MASRYQDKLAFINGIDPYLLKDSEYGASPNELPTISKNIIMDYLLFRTSQDTNQEIRAFKSLDAFAQFVCKWIEAILVKKIDEKFLVLSKVRHSQSVSKSLLKPWVILGPNGEILACHCTCIAGLGEVCTHIAAVLFGLEYAGRDETSVTDVLAYWIGPSKKGQYYKKLKDIDFTPPASISEYSEPEHNVKPLPQVPIPIPSTDFKILLNKL